MRMPPPNRFLLRMILYSWESRTVTPTQTCLSFFVHRTLSPFALLRHQIKSHCFFSYTFEVNPIQS